MCWLELVCFWLRFFFLREGSISTVPSSSCEAEWNWIFRVERVSLWHSLLLLSFSVSLSIFLHLLHFYDSDPTKIGKICPRWETKDCNTICFLIKIEQFEEKFTSVMDRFEDTGVPRMVLTASGLEWRFYGKIQSRIIVINARFWTFSIEPRQGWQKQKIPWKILSKLSQTTWFTYGALSPL